jgi:hypothetical protein
MIINHLCHITQKTLTDITGLFCAPFFAPNAILPPKVLTLRSSFQFNNAPL